MMVTPTQYENIQKMRQQLLNTPDGRETLCCQLMNMGLFQGADAMRRLFEDHPARMHTVIAAIGLLEALAVWNTESFMALLERMATLPMPQVNSKGVAKNGETTG